MVDINLDEGRKFLERRIVIIADYKFNTHPDAEGTRIMNQVQSR